MAIFHLSAKIIGRSRGRMATAAAAYRAGARIRDDRTGLVFDYTRRKHVAWRAIAAPSNVPAWALDRQQLWNAVEQAEKRRDAQVAREIEIALPRELDYLAQLRLIAEFIEAEFTERGMVVDACLHDNPNNPLTHLLITMRELRPDGFGAKAIQWNDKRLLMSWRKSWAERCNRALAREGIRQRIDHRSLVAQGITHRIAGRHEGVMRARLKRALTRRKRGNHQPREEIEMAQSTGRNDRATAEGGRQEGLSGGISPADRRQGAASRDEVATGDYQERVKDALGEGLYGVQYYPDHHSLHVRFKGGSLRDFGDRIVPKFGGLDVEVASMVRLAQVKGWDKICVSGSEHCRRGLWREAVQQGYDRESIVGYQPDADDLAYCGGSEDSNGAPSAACKPQNPHQARGRRFRR